ncbi:MAG TPA: phosphoglycerate kinase [Acidimicrobiia bacterium]|nr:phosphoglycerate kinase [Acidimicrobiia bacterium]
MRDLPTIDDLEVEGRTVLVRADLNVPLDGGAIGDDFRLRAALPTIEALRARRAAVVLCSHLGRPKGIDPAYSMKPVGARLSEIGGFPVTVADDVAGPGARTAVDDQTDDVVVLENTRFEDGETTNDPGFAGRLAALADAFVLDAFGSAHRAHASTVGVSALLPSAAGPLLLSEVRAFARIIDDPDRPFVVALGGAKVSDKLGVIDALLPKVDVMLVGGAMCFTLLVAEGYDVGDSRVEGDQVDAARKVLQSVNGGRVTLPTDVIVGERFERDTTHRVVPATDMPRDGMGLDIGPESAERFASILEGADTIFWNGPMGVFEWPAFASGTLRVAKAVDANRGYSVVGGGDTVAALEEFGLGDGVSHLSTGGGAGLELIEQGTLPGLEALRDGS